MRRCLSFLGLICFLTLFGCAGEKKGANNNLDKPRPADFPAEQEKPASKP